MPLNSTFSRKRKSSKRDTLGGSAAPSPRSATGISASPDRKSGGYKRGRKPPRFGVNENVSASVAKRTRRRAKRLGYDVSAFAGGITGFQARRVKRDLRRKKAAKKTYSI
jgi:pyruvate/2-oxoglutarate dehydrogenase complex dihydrolipoamide acyltransferase (E2) component